MLTRKSTAADNAMYRYPLSGPSEGFYQPVGRRQVLLCATTSLEEAWRSLHAVGDATLMTEDGRVTVFGGAYIKTVYTDIN